MPRREGLAIDGLIQNLDKRIQDENGRVIIEAIRRDEFGLDLKVGCNESLLKKQHSHLSRALERLSQELYSKILISSFNWSKIQMQVIILILLMWNQLWHLSYKALVSRS